MKFLLVCNPGIEKTRHSREIAQTVAQKLREQGNHQTEICNVDELEGMESRQADMILTFGGDGTIIHTAAHFVQSQTPILGINLGTVGFLSNLELDEIEEALPKLIAGDYDLEARTVLELYVQENGKESGPYFCINELCIKSPKAHMVQFHVMIDGALHSCFKGDGMLISTPTGSTAYALSAGGPVIDPELEVILLTPLVSYLLSKKPLVIAGHREVCLYGTNEQEAVLAVDGQVTNILTHPFQIYLKQAANRIQLVNLQKRNFFASVEKRLGQTAAPQNESLF